MAFKVALEGNPTSGKTELPPLIAAELKGGGLRVLDAKRWDLENGFLSNVRSRFVQNEIDTRTDLARSIIYHSVNYVGAMFAARSLEGEYDVILMQRLPWSYLYMVESLNEGWNGEFSASSLLYKTAEAWTRIARPDAVVYLECPREVLRARFALRRERNNRVGGDRVHQMLIERDDSVYVRFLRNYMGEGNFYMVDSASIPSAASEIAGLIRRELPIRKTVRAQDAEKVGMLRS